MDLAPLRALAVDLNFEWHGVDVIVTPDNEDLITTRGIWIVDTQYGPAGTSFQGVTSGRTLALPRAAVARIQVGATIQAPERTGGPVFLWTVEAIGESTPEQHRVTVVNNGPAT